jgi:hypothetical protein
MQMMTRKEALQYVSFQIDDAHDARSANPDDVGSDDHLVGFYESPGVVMVVAVRSRLPGVRLAEELAKSLARDYLTEIGWFGEESLEADFIV